MDRYNLTWRHACRALKLGAVCETKDMFGYGRRLIPVKGSNQFFTEDLHGFGEVKHWMTAWSSMYDICECDPLYKHLSFKIAGVVGCDITHQFINCYIKDNSFKIACNKHYTLMLYKGDNPKEQYHYLANECARVIEEEALKDE